MTAKTKTKTKTTTVADNYWQDVILPWIRKYCDEDPEKELHRDWRNFARSSGVPGLIAAKNHKQILKEWKEWIGFL